MADAEQCGARETNVPETGVWYMYSMTDSEGFSTCMGRHILQRAYGSLLH